MFTFRGFIATLLLFACSATLAASPEVIASVEKSDDGFVVSARALLPVSLRTAWTVLTDFDRMEDILSNLTSSKVLQRNGNTLHILQEGRAWYGPFFYTFSSEREIRLEPMKRILSRQLTGTTRHFESRMELSQTGEGTQLRYEAEIIPDSALARTFGSAFVQHEVEEQLTALVTEMLRRKAP